MTDITPKSPPSDQAEVLADRVEDERQALLRKARAKGSDDGDAANMGGAGAQGGQVDFGNPKNYVK